MRILIDAMGGDHAPAAIVEACVDAMRGREGFDLTLVGQEKAIRAELAKYEYPTARVRIVDAPEVIDCNESPTQAIRTKKNSSMVVALQLLKQGEGEAIISAGSTGAFLTGALLLVGRIKGVQRPTLAPLLPSRSGQVLLVDGGANMDCRSIYLQQFAVMGSVYYQCLFHTPAPRVGLVNVGVEAEKGNDLVKETYQALSQAEGINFIGNIEGRDITDGKADVAVCDGFVGNLILKSYEGVGLMVMDALKEALTSSFTSKLAAAVLKPGLKRMKARFSVEEHGGAMLLGIDAVVVKAHGSSKAKPYRNTIYQAVDMLEAQLLPKIKEKIQAASSTAE